MAPEVGEQGAVLLQPQVLPNHSHRKHLAIGQDGLWSAPATAPSFYCHVPSGRHRMLMERAISSTVMVSEISASAIISSLARGVSGAVSAGLSAVAKQNARKT